MVAGVEHGVGDLIIRLLVVAGLLFLALWMCSIGLRKRGGSSEPAQTDGGAAAEGRDTALCRRCGEVSGIGGRCPHCGARLTPRRAA
jgi:hypothetical protein